MSLAPQTQAVPSTTVSSFALITTFTPAPTCTEGHLTILLNRQYQIWQNEPLPVPGTTMTGCYPTEVLTSYLLSASSVSVPPFSELVCPQDHTTALQNGNYIACCPSSYTLGEQLGSANEMRPAYGRTCYSDIRSITVTAYDNSSATATSTLVFSTPAQAYAHVIDGFTATPTSSSHPASSSNKLSGGAIGGIVVGAVIALALFVIGWILFARRRKEPARPSEAPLPPLPPSTSPGSRDMDYFNKNPKAAYYGQDADDIGILPPVPAAHGGAGSTHAEMDGVVHIPYRHEMSARRSYAPTYELQSPPLQRPAEMPTTDWV